MKNGNKAMLEATTYKLDLIAKGMGCSLCYITLVSFSYYYYTGFL